MSIDVTSLHGRRATDRWNRMVIADVLERVTWSRPDKDALVGWPGAYATPEFARVTYREADRTCNRIAQALTAEGLERSDRVLLYCENSIEAILSLIGIAKAGLVAVPVNPLLAPDVLAWVVEHVEPRFAIVDGAHREKADAVLRPAGVTSSVTIPIGGDATPAAPAFAEWIADRPETEVDVAPALHADDVWSLLFTSGTTAMPKAVMATNTYSYAASYPYTLSLTRGLRYEDELRHLCFLPVIYHCGHHATLFASCLAGGTMVIGRRPDATEIARAVTAERATSVWAGAPQFVQGIADAALAHPDEIDISSLTVAMFSWGAMRQDMSETVARAAGDGHVELLEVFGQTEAMSCFRFWPDREPEKLAEAVRGTNHVGVPTPILAAAIMDAEGRILQGEPGVPGEAVYRSPAVTAGYYKNPEATEEAFAGGWFHSGDSCRYEEDGQQVMVDRYKDIVKSGGENVSSIRVEAVVEQHPAVARVAVVGLQDDRWGEVVTAVVQVAPGAELDPAHLIAFCRERLAGYETPKRIEVVDELPLTVGGKVLKYRLRRRFADLPA